MRISSTQPTYPELVLRLLVSFESILLIIKKRMKESRGNSSLIFGAEPKIVPRSGKATRFSCKKSAKLRLQGSFDLFYAGLLSSVLSKLQA